MTGASPDRLPFGAALIAAAALVVVWREARMRRGAEGERKA